MKTVSNFIKVCVDYFGNFQNAAVALLVTEELRSVKPTDLDVVFRQLVLSPSNELAPRYEGSCRCDQDDSSRSACRGAKSPYLPGLRTDDYSGGACPTCKYDGRINDGSPDAYRSWWGDWKAGRVQRFDVAAVIVGLAREKVIAG